jgi:hypothetical protein
MKLVCPTLFTALSVPRVCTVSYILTGSQPGVDITILAIGTLILLSAHRWRREECRRRKMRENLAALLEFPDGASYQPVKASSVRKIQPKEGQVYEIQKFKITR